MTAHHDPTPRIGRTSALEQHAQTVMTAVLSAGILASIGFAWRASNTLERIAVLQTEQVKVIDRMVSKVDDIDHRLDSIEVRMARYEATQRNQSRAHETREAQNGGRR